MTSLCLTPTSERHQISEEFIKKFSRFTEFVYTTENNEHTTISDRYLCRAKGGSQTETSMAKSYFCGVKIVWQNDPKHYNITVRSCLRRYHANSNTLVPQIKILKTHTSVLNYTFLILVFFFRNFTITSEVEC